MNLKTGKKGEKHAVNYLLSLGYRIVLSNFYTRFGEIDIVAQKEDRTIFIEVKTRKTDFFGSPEEAFTNLKGLRIYKSIMEYFKIYKHTVWQIDFVAIKFNSFDEVCDIRHYKNVQIF